MRSLPDGGSADGAAWKRECKLKYRHTASDRQSSCSGPGTRASVRMRTSWLNLEQSQLAPRGREDMADALAASTPPVPRSPTQAPSVPAPPAVDALPTTTTTTAAPSTSVPSPSPAPSATPVPLPDNPFDNPASEAARAALQASRWNGLLRWGRAARLGGHGGAPAGWDFATGMYHVPRDSPEWTAGVERAQMCVLMRVTRRRELCSLLTLLPCSLTVTSPGSSTQRKCLRTASLSLPFAISSPSPFLPHPQRPVLRPRPNPHAPIQQHPLAPQPRRGPLGRRARWRRRRRCGRGRRRRDADGEWAAKEEGRQVR
ncbi:hypothetical protein DMC30DRAFT_404629 [Rhodotorula diobovata]|uniref:Uncharacterized protein n=1 Tax=Rhodotorula diobovata TaxID=5288 RepID=A0A5C5FNR7_9BASI|nr:hypothetical protein DMC30DRAFT_404629 [Rhodotorula diobovata]